MFNRFNKSKGAISSIILILAVVLIIVIIIVFVVIKITASKNADNTQKDINSTITNEPLKPVHEVTLEDIKFTLQSSTDLGNILQSKDNRYNQKITTTEKFIQVVIGAQNQGKNDTAFSVWGVGNIIDSEGRNFISINNRAYFFLPQPNLCGALLKPVFDPVSCVMLYEVSKVSTGLKVEVNVISPKSAKSLIDLGV